MNHHRAISACTTASLLCFAATAFATNTLDVMEGHDSRAVLHNRKYFSSDWAWRETKGECAISYIDAYSTGGIEGISANYNNHVAVHGLLCSTQHWFDEYDWQQGESTTVWRDYDVGAFPKKTGFPNGWDWDIGYPKATCGAGMFVTGIAQKYYDTPTPGTPVDVIRCALPLGKAYGGQLPRLERDDANCYHEVFGINHDGTWNGDSPQGQPDWDYGFVKGWCYNGGLIAGISHNLSTDTHDHRGGVHAILCCPANTYYY